MVDSLNFLRVVGVLGGRDMTAERVGEWARSADVVFAADSGADLLLDEGIIPAATVGDLDSIHVGTRAIQTKVLDRPDQNSSDCDKLLSYAEACGYQAITLCAVEGDLMDHVWGTVLSACRSSLNVRFALRKGVAWILRGPIESRFELFRDVRLSLMPITTCKGVRLAGTEWPLEDVVLDPLGMNSLSNRALGPVTVRVENGVAILIASHPSLEKPHW